MIRTDRLTLAPALAVAFALLAAPRGAFAKSEKTTLYTFEQVWGSAVRFFRIDERCEIVEKDADAGYILFELGEENKKFRGALEIVRIVDDLDRPALRLVLRLDDRPSYMELGMLERLERKLRAEHGEPREPPKKRKPRKPADKDKDKPEQNQAADGSFGQGNAMQRGDAREGTQNQAADGSLGHAGARDPGRGGGRRR